MFGPVRACLVILALACAPAACRFDARGLGVDGAPDRGLPDIARLDAAQLIDTGDGEAGACDVAFERAQPDLPWPDTSPWPDSVPWPDSAPPSCKASYGQLPGYKLCQESPTSCLFYVKASDSCTNVCATAGGSCLAAAADNGDTCTALYALACTDVQADGLCTCSR